MFYGLHMRGSKPTYFTKEDREKAISKYYYMKRYFSGVSLTRQSWQRVVKDYLITGRTA